MHLIRRSVFRSLQAQTVAAPSRSFASRTQVIQARVQPSICWPARRFYSDDKSNVSPAEEAGGETVEAEPPLAEQRREVAHESIATEDVKDASKSALDQVKSAAESVLGAATAAVTPNSSRPQSTEGRILYVGNLYFDLSPELLRETFEKIGKVVNSRIVTDSTGLSKGFGYIEFEHAADAETAIRELDQAPLEGRRMAVQFHVRRQRSQFDRGSSGGARNPPARTLFIGNISFQMADSDLNELFRSIKGVQDVRVAVDRKTGQPRGFAHADFVDVASAEAAKKELEGKVLYGRSLRIDFGLPSIVSRQKVY